MPVSETTADALINETDEKRRRVTVGMTIWGLRFNDESILPAATAAVARLFKLRGIRRLP